MDERKQLIQQFDESRQMASEKFTVTLTFPWGETGTVAQVIRGMIIPHEREHFQEIKTILADEPCS